MDDDDVGYGKPPKKSRFRPGQSGNPEGSSRKARDRKKKVTEKKNASLAATLERIGKTEIEVNGETFTLIELELLALHKKAAKGDVAASKHLKSLRAEAGLLKPDERRTGVLAVPMAIDLESWEYLAAKNQAKYRTNEPWNPDNFVLAKEGEEDL